jgi:hypothetical protein
MYIYNIRTQAIKLSSKHGESEMIDINVLKSANTFASFKTSTEPSFKAPKRNAEAFKQEVGCPMEHVRKCSKFVALVGTNLDYSRMIENRITKEMTSDEWSKEDIGLVIKGLEKGQLAWGEMIDGVEIAHKGEQYVRCYFFGANEETAEDLDQLHEKLQKVHHTQVYYFDNRTGERLNTEAIKPFLTDKSQNSDRQAGNQQLVVPRTFKLASILSVKVNGQIHHA